MFSSNPSPQVPSSTNVFSDSFFDYDKDNLDLTTSSSSKSITILCPPSVTHDVFHHQFSGDQNNLIDSVILKKKMTVTKKDGPRSKIYTARGPRDRRVRLSIGISRKFFCLHDLLGFDTASRTLDWLLTKSLTAIKELVDCSSSTVTDESKVEFLETIKRDSDYEEGCKKRKSQCLDGKGKNVLREQLRAEARARAGKRTKLKNLVKKLDACESASQFELQNGYEDISWEFLIDQETFNQSEGLSF